MEQKLLQYIVGDLDPSEALLIEKKIQEDQDTLIEVESLRAIMAKLDHLPDLAPPDHVIQNIEHEAREFHNPPRATNVIKLAWFKNMAKYAAVAALLVFAYVGVEHTFFTPHFDEASGQNLKVERIVTPWKDSKQVITINSASVDNVIDSVALKNSNLRPVDDPIEAQVRRDGVKLATQRKPAN